MCLYLKTLHTEETSMFCEVFVVTGSPTMVYPGMCVPKGEWSKVPEGQSFNVFPCISLLTLDVMLRCTCSYDSHCQTNKSVSLSYLSSPFTLTSSRTHDPYIKSVFDLSTLTTRRIL